MTPFSMILVACNSRNLSMRCGKKDISYTPMISNFEALPQSQPSGVLDPLKMNEQKHVDQKPSEFFLHWSPGQLVHAKMHTIATSDNDVCRLKKTKGEILFFHTNGLPAT